MTRESSPFLQACRREPTRYTPVWFMRQAGRSLPEFRAIREKHAFMDVCHQPELCAEVTLQPIRRLGVDAAILFADIMTPLIETGWDIDLVEHVGPVIRQPVRSMSNLVQFRTLSPEQDLTFVIKTIQLVKAELGDRIPVIGFAGAPFTLAAYLIEGSTPRAFAGTKALMYGQSELWQGLMERLTELTIVYLRAQIDSGADAVQLFDSWVGCLSPVDYATYVRPYTQRVLGAVRALGKPIIHFGTNTATLLDQMRDDGGTVIGVDWRIPLDAARSLVGPGIAIQGNLDPAVLLGTWDIIRTQAITIMRQAAGQSGHVFNLGHGILPETPLDHIVRLVELVHEYDPESAGV